MRQLIVIISLLGFMQQTSYCAIFDSSRSYSELAKSDTTCNYWKKITEESQKEARDQKIIAKTIACEAERQSKLAQEAIEEAILQSAKVAYYQQKLHMEQVQIVMELKEKLSRCEVKIEELEKTIKEIRKKE